MSAEWPKVRLGEVLKPVSRPVTVEPNDTYRILGAHWYAQGLYTKEVKDGSQIRAKTLYRIEEGDFVYNRLFAWKGSFAIATDENGGCYASNEFPCFSINRERVDGQYLWRYFSRASAWNEALGLSTGGTPTSRNRLKENKFLAMKIPLPPLDEQRRTVARIEELAARIEEAQDLRRQAAEEAEALKGEALMKYLDRKGKSTVKDFASIQSGYAFKSEWFSESGMRLVRNVNIGHGKINWDNTARIPETTCSEFSRFKLSEGDILISLDRPIISTGVKVARVSAKDVPSLLLQRVGRVCFHNHLVLPEFFFCWLQSPSFIYAIDPGRSNGVPHISQRDIERITFTPPTLDEQRRIVARLDELQAQVDGLKKHQVRTAEELAALLPAVLDRAFRGQL